MQTTRLMAASTALALCVLAVPALAEDSKTMPGNACQARQPGDLQFLFRSLASDLRSSGAKSVSVICPVTKDVASGRLKRAEVRVLDRNPVGGSDVACTLVSNRSDGSVQHFQILKSTGGSSAVQTLKFASQPVVANGSYNLDCELPPFSTTFGTSSVVMYTIVEE